MSPTGSSWRRAGSSSCRGRRRRRLTSARSPTPPGGTRRPAGRATQPMSTSGTEPFPGDVAVAEQAARAAADVLVRLRGQGLTGRPLGDAGDAAAQQAFLGVLDAERQDDVVFSEEAVDDPRRLGADRVWIVDPLDG